MLYLIGERLKVVWAKFSTLSLAVSIFSTVSALYMFSLFRVDRPRFTYSVLYLIQFPTLYTANLFLLSHLLISNSNKKISCTSMDKI
jgi:hypothetical protein